jgi:hypothetical protein
MYGMYLQLKKIIIDQKLQYMTSKLQEKHHHSKENIQHVKHEISSLFSISVGYFLPPPIQIRIPNAGRIRIQLTKINVVPGSQHGMK